MSIDANRYSYEGLKNLGRTLNATRVLSDSFAGDLFAMALQVASEAHAAGRELERERNPASDANEIARLKAALGAAELQHRTYVKDRQDEIQQLRNALTDAVGTERVLREDRDRSREALTSARAEASRLRSLLEAERERTRFTARQVDKRCEQIEAGVLEIGERLEQEKNRSAGFYARARRAEMQVERMRRERCEEAGCERPGRIQRCSQPLSDCVVGQ